MFNTLWPERKNLSTTGNIAYPSASASTTSIKLAETENISLRGNSKLRKSASVVGATVPVATLPLLSSNPSATSKIFLDFNGHTTSGTDWNTFYNLGANIVTPAYSIDADTRSEERR